MREQPPQRVNAPALQSSVVTIFGVPWDQLELEHVRAFLADAGPEPLLWEAKGTEVTKGEIRVQVCGFANSHEGGFLILGATENDDGAWTLDGVEFPNDPPTWISDVVGSGAVTPYPDGLDTRARSVGNGRHVAVVRIPAIAMPPCNTRGRVYERVSGKTIPVTVPLRLAALFGRGDQARAAAHTSAGQAAAEAMERGVGHSSHDDTHIQFGLGLASAGYAPDIASRLFGRPFELGAISSVQTVRYRHETGVINLMRRLEKLDGADAAAVLEALDGAARAIRASGRVLAHERMFA
jgi:hypothetical protein